MKLGEKKNLTLYIFIFFTSTLAQAIVGLCCRHDGYQEGRAAPAPEAFPRTSIIFRRCPTCLIHRQLYMCCIYAVDRGTAFPLVNLNFRVPPHGSDGTSALRHCHPHFVYTPGSGTFCRMQNVLQNVM